MSIERALEDLRAGKFVLVHSQAEDEVDMAIAAQAVEPHHVARMRMEAGGLICVALHSRVAENFGLPYMTRVYEIASRDFKILGRVLPHKRSSFSLSVDHRRTHSGITDIDRALTIKELAGLAKRALGGSMVEEFVENFRGPGHVPLLRAADSLLAERRGHTELVIALAELAGITPAVVICEMLDERAGMALSLEAADEYAGRQGLQCLRGDEIVRAWESR